MSRRHYSSSVGDHIFEDIVKLSSLIPWWITIPIALLLFYFVPYGEHTDILMTNPPSMVWIMLGTFVKAVFKFLLPLALVIGAAISILSKFKSISLFNSIRTNGAHETVQGLSWQDFEFLLSEWFKKEGYSTELTGGGGADGGIDIKLYKDGEFHIVQCKHYKAWKVPVTVVRELYGIMTSENATKGYVVTSGRFTAEAHNFVQGKPIELIDGKKLEIILNSIHAKPTTATEPLANTCPKCGSDLVKREGKYGPFLGCASYPKCHYTQATK